MKNGYVFGLTLCSCGHAVKENYMVRHLKSDHMRFIRTPKSAQQAAKADGANAAPSDQSQAAA